MEKKLPIADVMSDVMKIVNGILNSPKKSREFHELVTEIGGDGHLIILKCGGSLVEEYWREYEI